MNKRPLAVFALIAVLCCLSVAAWGWAVFLDMGRQFAYLTEVSDLADLTGQYAGYRIENGEWPEPEKLYGCYFHIVNSEHVRGYRVDTYRSGSTWVQFYLPNEGRMSGRMTARVTWGEQMPIAKPM